MIALALQQLAHGTGPTKVPNISRVSQRVSCQSRKEWTLLRVKRHELLQQPSAVRLDLVSRHVF
jgi:hypothetical protein